MDIRRPAWYTKKGAAKEMANHFIKPPPGMSVADKMADGDRFQWLISSGATITLANAISIKASDPHFRAACDLGMEIAKDG